MTALRPEREGAHQGAPEPDPYAPYEPSEPHDAYEGTDAFAAAVERLDDPLTDPLPRPSPGLVPGTVTGPAAGPPAAPMTGRTTGPMTGPMAGPLPGAARTPAAGPVAGRAAPSVPEAAPASERPPGGPSRARHRRAAPAAPTGPVPPVDADATTVLPPVSVAGAPAQAPAGQASGGQVPGGRRTAGDDETVALRAVRAGTADGLKAAAAPPPGDDQTVLLRKVGAGPAEAEAADGPQGPPAASSGGRAARRRAAQAAARRGGRRGTRAGGDTGTVTAAGSGPRSTTAPRTRMEAKRAARARKDSPAAVVSRLVGELFITVGVLMLLFVTYQLWWTNIVAHQQANGAANSLQKKWDQDGGANRDPGTFSPGEGFAILYIPKLDVKAPIAEGISKQKVLDHGMVGHYGSGKLKTAMPWDKKGNFALAGHRNTHGEPFRYINHLKPGDKIVVETQNAYFTYEMTSILPQTQPSNTGVIGPVPPGSGFTEPGRYITLTTCTPEFTSKYRMIVWGKMVDERPRSKGKPDALVQ
ncbi:class E sortase [Streptomyces sp. ME19-01-6]|uniref:class E sortase n=1 Tax=Streptomyces sp. ME19-01-6 TaxID=3028686 RepID=UPI0029AD5CB7|nr:class E sortase [Streptomyces sp. ME19-01-6]MDX3226945.1 class E sortase [Streptomyces sp. ME19-01-6]